MGLVVTYPSHPEGKRGRGSVIQGEGILCQFPPRAVASHSMLVLPSRKESIMSVSRDRAKLAHDTS